MSEEIPKDEEKKQELLKLQEEKIATYEEARDYLSQILDKISSRFTKKYHPNEENTMDPDSILIPVEFFERRNKLPVPESTIVMNFKVPKRLKKKQILFQIKNEAVYYPLFESINLASFETLIDRVLRDKYQMNKALNLHTNFEHSRILTLNGEIKKLYTIEEEEEIFSNNNSEYYRYEGIDFKFKKPLDVKDIHRLTKVIWKTFVANKSKNEDHSKDEMTFDEFKLLFEYGKLDMNEENMGKLWKYTNSRKAETITFEDFANFAFYLIICLVAYTTAKYKHDNNNCFQNKIQTRVSIMNLHFKEYDTESNQEISYEDLKKCLLKENELFTRKEIDIILKQINPEKNFQYWKFDKILSILYNKYFDYEKLYSEDKIFKYLITIFSKQDEFHTGKLFYKKMKKAFLTEDKIKFDKMQILLLLNQFGINQNPEIDYFEASLILRNIVLYLHSSEIELQKIDISQPCYKTYEQYEDEYDKHCRDYQSIFLQYDEDFDHLLCRKEFDNFVKWIVPYAEPKDYDEIFSFMDEDKDGVVNFKDFKHGFSELMDRIRIKNVVKEIKTIV
ncbi:MAG: hypothetical protein MJ252_04935 [archaeon]|nr:hypothetical protein [archaeon]